MSLELTQTQRNSQEGDGSQPINTSPAILDIDSVERAIHGHFLDATFRKLISSKRQPSTATNHSTAEETESHFNYSSWILIAILTIIGLIHMIFLLVVIFRDPTTVNIVYKNLRRIEIPRVLICQPFGRFLDPEKLDKLNITAEYYFALEAGIGIFTEDMSVDFRVMYKSLDLQLLRDEHERIIGEYGDPITALLQFREQNGLECNKLFRRCWTGTIKQVDLDCCSVFSFVFVHSKGFCYVSKKGAISIGDINQADGFAFGIDFSPLAPYPYLPGEAHSSDGLYTLTVYDELNQNMFNVLQDNVVGKSSKYGQKETVSLEQKQRLMLPNRKRCVSEDEQLKYYSEYGIANCFWENNVDLWKEANGIECDLPLMAILNPTFQTERFCTLEEILQIFQYKSMDLKAEEFTSESLQWLDEQKICQISVIKDSAQLLPTCSLDLLRGLPDLPPDLQSMVHPTVMWSDLSNLVAQNAPDVEEESQLIELLNNTACDISYISVGQNSSNAHTEGECSVEALLQSQLQKTVKRVLRQSFERNTLPLKFSEVLTTRPEGVEVAESDALCLPLCSANKHRISFNHQWNPTEIEDEKQVYIVSLHYVTSEVEVTEEQPKLDWSEYLSLIGGNIGMWNGWSLLTLVYMIFFLAARRQCVVT